MRVVEALLGADNTEGRTAIISRYPATKALRFIRAQDPQYRFFGMIASKARPRGRKELEAFMAGQPINYTYLASTIQCIIRLTRRTAALCVQMPEFLGFRIDTIV